MGQTKKAEAWRTMRRDLINLFGREPTKRESLELNLLKRAYTQLRGLTAHSSMDHKRKMIAERKGTDKQVYSFKKEFDQWYYIPSGLQVAHMLYFVHQYLSKLIGPVHFLDVGAGPGNVVRLAEIIGFAYSHGIDIEEDFVKYYGKYNNCFKVADMFAFTDYGKYDLVYAYQPLTDGKKMGEFIDQVLYPRMKSGAFLLFTDAEGTPSSKNFEVMLSRWGDILYYKP